MEILLYSTLGIVLLLLVISVITLLVEKYIRKKLKNFHPVYVRKLDNTTNDNIKEAMQYLKLTNSIKN